MATWLWSPATENLYVGAVQGGYWRGDISNRFLDREDVMAENIQNEIDLQQLKTRLRELREKGIPRPKSKAPSATVKFMQVDQVARILAMDTKTVERLAQSGDIPCFSLGRRLQFSETDFFKWVESQTGA